MSSYLDSRRHVSSALCTRLFTLHQDPSSRIVDTSANMTDETNTPATHWTGFGWHQLLRERPVPQRFCARRRDSQAGFEASSTHVDIAILTATAPSEPNSTCPPEKACFWHTHMNVVSSLTRVLANASWTGGSWGGHFIGAAPLNILDLSAKYDD